MAPTVSRVEGGNKTLGRRTSSFRHRSQSFKSLRLRNVFDLFDMNRDGEITIVELSLALDRLGLGTDQDELASTVAAFVGPGRTGLDFEGFEGLHQALGDSFFGGCPAEHEVVSGQEAESDMVEAFRVFDEDGDGYISATELQLVLTKLGMPEATNIDRVHEMICSVDQNNDGRVDYYEFKQMMSGVSVWGA